MIGWLLKKLIGHRPDMKDEVSLRKVNSLSTIVLFNKRISHEEHNYIRTCIDSCKLDIEISTAIEWIHNMYRKGYFKHEAFYHELIHYAIYKEEKILKAKMEKEFIRPHVKKRANEIIEEERLKKIRLVKNENKTEVN